MVCRSALQPQLPTPKLAFTVSKNQTPTTALQIVFDGRIRKINIFPKNESITIANRQCTDSSIDFL